MDGIKCEMKCGQCARSMCTGARKLADEAGAGSVEKRYVVKHVRTGRWLDCELEGGRLVAGLALYGEVRSFTRAQAQALVCVWIAAGGDDSLVIEEASHEA